MPRGVARDESTGDSSLADIATLAPIVAPLAAVGYGGYQLVRSNFPSWQPHRRSYPWTGDDEPPAKRRPATSGPTAEESTSAGTSGNLPFVHPRYTSAIRRSARSSSRRLARPRRTARSRPGPVAFRDRIRFRPRSISFRRVPTVRFVRGSRRAARRIVSYRTRIQRRY